jgi:hypothetical protein
MLSVRSAHGRIQRSLTAAATAVVPCRTFIFGKKDSTPAPAAKGANPNLQSLPQPGIGSTISELKTDAEVAAERAARQAKRQEMQRKLRPMIDKARNAAEKAKAREAAEAAAAEAAAAAPATAAPTGAAAAAGAASAGLFATVKSAWRARREYVNYTATRSAEKAMSLDLSQIAVQSNAVLPPPPTRLDRASPSKLLIPLWAPEFQTLRTDLEGTFARRSLDAAAAAAGSSGAADAPAAAAAAAGPVRRATVATHARPASASAIAAASGGAAPAAASGSSSAPAPAPAVAAAGVSAADVALIGAMDLCATALDGGETCVRERVQVPGRVTFMAISSSEKSFGPALGMQRIVAQHFAADGAGSRVIDGSNSNGSGSGSKGKGKRAGAARADVSVATLHLSLAHGHIVKTLLANSIRGNLQRQIPQYLHSSVLPFFEATSEEPLGRMRTILDCRNATAAYFFIIDERGLVRWRCGQDRMFTAEEAGRTLELIEELVEETRYNEA